MFGKVIEVNKNFVRMLNGTNVSQPSIMNFHVVFDEDDRKIIGEVVSCDDKYISGDFKQILFVKRGKDYNYYKKCNPFHNRRKLFQCIFRSAAEPYKNRDKCRNYISSRKLKVVKI